MEHTSSNAAYSAVAPGCAATSRANSARLKSPEEAQRWFADRGITISEWAMARQFNPALVYQVLAGTRKAVRGTSFKIAVELGIKALPIDDLEAA